MDIVVSLAALYLSWELAQYGTQKFINYLTNEKKEQRRHTKFFEEVIEPEGPAYYNRGPTYYNGELVHPIEEQKLREFVEKEIKFLVGNKCRQSAMKKVNVILSKDGSEEKKHIDERLNSDATHPTRECPVVHNNDNTEKPTRDEERVQADVLQVAHII